MTVSREMESKEVGDHKSYCAPNFPGLISCFLSRKVPYTFAILNEGDIERIECFIN